MLWVMAFTLWSHRDGYYKKGQVILLLGERLLEVVNELLSEPVIHIYTNTQTHTYTHTHTTPLSPSLTGALSWG